MKEADEAEHEGRELPDRRSAFGGAHESDAARERCTQHTATIHREGGNEIEERKEEIQRSQAIHHRDLHVIDAHRGACTGVRVGESDQCTGDDHVHYGTGDRNEEFLPRLLRNALELRDAPNRQ